MLVGIIKEEINNDLYYVHLEDNFKFSIVHVNDNIVEVLKSEEVKTLFENVFSSKLTYKEKYNNYDIYIDESDNKRYFKDGVEDFKLFFDNNGVSAISYFEKIDKDRINNSKVKRIKIITTLLAFEIMFSPAFFMVTYANTDDFVGNLELITDYNKGLSLIEAKELINDSRNLTNVEKELLCNESLLKFVLKYSNNNRRQYSLRCALKNIGIERFSINQDETCKGYYNLLEINKIHIRDDVLKNTDEYDDTLLHEFVHLLQDSNKYTYIHEACAEIISNEFAKTPNLSYIEECKRVKVLMEIIGPKPIIECEFDGYTTGFEYEIGNYLSDEDKDKLLHLFEITSEELNSSLTNRDKVNEEIDNLLAKMYRTKTGNDIREDPMISLIYAVNPTNRIYFNEDSKMYNKEYYLSPMRIDYPDMTIEEAINRDVEKYIWVKEEKKEIEGKSVITYKKIETTDFSTINNPGKHDWVDIYFKDGTQGHVNYGYETNTWCMVEHYQLSQKLEPSIRNKFKKQFEDSDKYIEILEMVESNAEKENSKVK